MFEKEAEERARKLKESQTLGVYNSDEELAQDVGWNAGEVSGYENGFKDGAEFGYNKAFVEADKNLKAIVTDFNKANEWHYMKDGIMPEENQWVLVYDGSYTVCNYHSNTPIKWLDNYENEVYEGSIIAWKEIVLPKEI